MKSAICDIIVLRGEQYMTKKYKFECKICGNKLVKNGKTSKGKQRYKCKNCNTSKIKNNGIKQRQNELKMFIKYVTDSTKKKHKTDKSRMTFYRKTNWCWEIKPTLKPPKNSSKYVFIDATYIGRDVCFLIVKNSDFVLNFAWTDKENFYNYYELLKDIPEPEFAICDGHNGIEKACKKLWKNIDIQRCLVHVARDCERKLGKRSPCNVNQIFRHHINRLPRLNTQRKADFWLKRFYELYEQHQEFIEEKRFRLDEFGNETKKYDRVHKNLFSATNQILSLIKKEMLFTHIGNDIPNNSNSIEGGINSPLKYLLRCHRGISLEHQKKMFEWYLLTRSNIRINDFIKTLIFN